MVKPKNKLEALSINEQLGDIPTHFMKSGSAYRPTNDLNSLAEFIVKISNDAPFLYGAFAIILAVTLGALMAWLRKIVHDLRHKKPKQEEVKFPVK